MTTESEIGGAVYRIRRHPAGKQNIRETVVVELPKRLVFRYQTRQMPAKLRVARRESRLHKTLKGCFALLFDLGEIGLKVFVEFKGTTAVCGKRHYKVQSMRLVRAQLQIENQHALLLDAIRRPAKSLRGCGLGMLRLKDQALPVLTPTHLVVGLSGRVDKPRFGFLGDRAPKVEAEREAP